MKKEITGTNSFNIWRVVFTFVIMLFHLTDQYTSFYVIYPNLYYHWYVAVEFFFILSGFLMAKHAVIHDGESALTYSKNRIIRLFPEYIAVFLIMIAWRSLAEGNSLSQLLTSNWEEAIMFQSIGTGKFPYVNNPAWYVSSLFIAGHFIYYLLQRHKRLFLEFIGPILIIGLLKVFYQDYEALNGFFSTSEFGVSVGILRALLGLTVGVYVYYLSERLKKYPNKWFKRLLAIAEVCAFSFILVFSITHENMVYDFGFLFIMAFGVLAASLNSVFCRISSSGVIYFLSQISYAMFLSHFLALRIIALIWPGTEWKWITVPIYITVTLVVASIIHFGIMKMIDLIKNLKQYRL